MNGWLQNLVRALFRAWFTWVHGVELRGLEHYPAADQRAVVVVNHLSFGDGCFVAAFLPGIPVFAVNSFIARQWWAKPLLSLIRTYEVDPTNPYAVKGMVKAVQSGSRLVIFPEGRITKTGALMKIYDGAAMVADKADAPMVAVRIDGLQFSFLSRMGGVVRRRLAPPLRLTVFPPQRLTAPAGLPARARRQALGVGLQELMERAQFNAEPLDKTLWTALLDASARYGAGTLVAEDIQRAPISYRRLIRGAVALGRLFERQTGPGEAVGLLLPNANACVASFFALHAFGRTPAMLNFTAGAEGMLAACAAARITTVISARQFIDKARLGAVVEAMAGQVQFIWLEEAKAEIGAAAKLRALLDGWTARRLPGARGAATNPAAVLFTSGSEGKPKGVVLSHRNLLANCAQLAAVIDFNPADRVFNALPMFHAFGLTGGTLIPLMAGAKVFLYPSPLHYRIVPEAIYDTDATLCFGTDTFLTGWARFAHPYDFYRMRYIFAGAEKLRDETRKLYADKFGVRVLEGYGATEAAPVLALNTAMRAQAGSAGRLLPGITHRLDPIEGVPTGGRLWVRGPNIMLGYYRPESPGLLQPPEDGWHDTGDIATVDEHGFVKLMGRAKRFAKIGGEMVSLTAAEALAAAVWPDAAHAVVALPDPRKGEQLVLVTTQPEAEASALIAAAQARGAPELATPRKLIVVKALPLLGVGKTDYPAVSKLAAERFAAG